METEARDWSDLLGKIGFKKIAIFFGLMILAVIIYVVVLFVINQGRALVKIQFAPNEAVVKIDGEVVKNNERNYIQIGEHVVTVEFENFEKHEVTVNVDKNIDYIGGILTAINDEGRAYIISHQAEFDEIKIASGGASDVERQNLYEKLINEAPVASKLPFSNALFSLNYLLDEEKPTLTISASTTYMDEAVAKLKSLVSEDENLVNYNIEFLSFNNPLEGSFKENDEDGPRAFLKNGYSEVTSFDIKRVEESDDYYCFVVTTGSEEKYSLVTYRAIVKKDESGKFVLMSNPEPILTIYNTVGVPVEILTQVNSF